MVFKQKNSPELIDEVRKLWEDKVSPKKIDRMFKKGTGWATAIATQHGFPPQTPRPPKVMLMLRCPNCQGRYEAEDVMDKCPDCVNGTRYQGQPSNVKEWMI
jgi:hypothetical protein